MIEFNDLILYFKESLVSGKLPGKSIQFKMAPPGRPEDYPVKESVNDSAVALVLYEKNEELHFPLIKRTSSNKNDKHKGQISLPGGKFDKEDLNLVNCAMREFEEELGIAHKYISLLGDLTDLYIPVSNFKVHPFVFYLDKKPKFRPQPSEVEYVLEIKLKDILNEKNIKTGKISQSSFSSKADVPYFDLNNHIIWGATAMILNEFKNVASGFKTK